MVKHLRHVGKGFALLLLLGVAALTGLGIWLHEGERTLGFAKPWITEAINVPGAPYEIAIGEVKIDWTNAAELGKIHITDVSFAKRDGALFASLPEIYATIDPLGFLPGRRMIHKVILRQPHLAMVRDESGAISLGIEGARSPLALADMVSFFSPPASEAAAKDAPASAPDLPFRDFRIEDASLRFNDAKSGTEIESSPFNLRLKRRQGHYEAVASMPFTVDASKANLTAHFRPALEAGMHELAITLQHVPAPLVCLFGGCSKGMALEGALDGTASVTIADDGALHAVGAEISTEKATLTAPEWFAEPLPLTKSSVSLMGDWGTQHFTLNQASLVLPDTTITASGELSHAERGYSLKLAAEASRLNIAKLYKYWPLTMAPDSRHWVTNKLKSGESAKASLTVNLTPEDFAAPEFPKDSIDAWVDAEHITFEYLPGFPLVEKMNGKVHFTATTVKIEGGGGTFLSGAKVEQATLWCPELNSAHNPMEATLKLTAPASDVATYLALKPFTFDDDFGLNPNTIRGTVGAEMTLKFNAFSGKKGSENELHLEAVDYDIRGTLKDVAQDSIYGGYRLRGVNGSFAADTKRYQLEGDVLLGDAPTNHVALAQTYGKPLSVAVKGNGPVANDFTLTYQKAKNGSVVSLKGARLDATRRYTSGAGDSVLKHFPAIQASVDLGTLWLDAQYPLKQLVATLSCSAARCESGAWQAKAGDATLQGGIREAGGERHFHLQASKAGEALKALGVSDRVTGGTLELSGAYDDSIAPPQLNARLAVKDFTMKNAQILGRILSIGSLTGLSNALTGSGIAFEKLTADVSARAGVFTIQKGVASGTALGITVGGTLDDNHKTYALKGVVAPAYALNSLLGKIPLIGFIAGGADEGLIAFNYSVGGTFEQPDVSVNPLSGLTPGFLRKIFSVFDSEEEE